MWVTPPASGRASIEAPVLKPPPRVGGLARSTAAVLRRGCARAGAGPARRGRRFLARCRPASRSRGLRMSTRPSLSSSSSLAQAGGCRRGPAGAAGERARRFRRVQPRESAPAKPTPSAVTSRKAGQGDDQCELVSHAAAPRYPPHGSCDPVPCLSPRNRHAQATGSYEGAQRRAAAPNKPLIKAVPCAATHRRQDFSRAGCAG